MNTYERFLRRLMDMLPGFEVSITQEVMSRTRNVTASRGDQSNSIRIPDEILTDIAQPESLAEDIAQQLLPMFRGEWVGSGTFRVSDSMAKSADFIPLPVELMNDLETSKPGATEERIREILSKPEGSEMGSLATGGWIGNPISFAATTMSSTWAMTSASMMIRMNTSTSWG